MQRINLGKPYEDFIKEMIASGYYGTATEVIRDALRDKMDDQAMRKRKRMLDLIEQGRESITQGRTIQYNKDFKTKVWKESQELLDTNAPIPDYISGKGL